MAKLPILVAPHPTLKAKAKKVTEFTPELKSFADDMLETMYDAPGIGLAANQVDDLRRIFVMDCSARDDGATPYQIINPVITWTSDEVGFYEEGCLSLPEQYADVERPLEVKIDYQDVDGHKHSKHFQGLEATCVQHEIDHLDGKLFVDYLSPLKRNMLMKKLRKTMKERGDA